MSLLLSHCMPSLARPHDTGIGVVVLYNVELARVSTTYSNTQFSRSLCFPSTQGPFLAFLKTNCVRMQLHKYQRTYCVNFTEILRRATEKRSVQENIYLVGSVSCYVTDLFPEPTGTSETKKSRKTNCDYSMGHTRQFGQLGGMCTQAMYRFNART